MTIFEIKSKEIEGLDPAQFTDLMNHLLEAEARKCRVPPCNVYTTDCISESDAGIDAKVIDVPDEIESEWLPPGESVWQFKSGKIGPAKIQKEMGIPGVKEALQRGATYCLSLAEDYPAEKARKKREETIEEEFGKLELPPKYRPYYGRRIARWASQFLSIILLDYFSRPLGGLSRIEHWEQKFQWPADFYWDKEREAIKETIINQLKRDDGQIHLRVEGLPGVGKSRLVLEILRESNLGQLVLVAPYVDAIPPGLWGWFASNPDTKGILVIDEATTPEAERFERQAMRANWRLRLITIGGVPEVPYVSPEGFFPLGTLDKSEMEVLVKTIDESLPQYVVDFVVQMAGGYVKLAVLIVEAIRREPRMASATEILQHRVVRLLLKKLIPELQEEKAMKALSLLKRVGWEGELAGEGKAVAEFMGISWADICDIVAQMVKKGTVARQGRYRYVTPELLAIWLAQDVWDARGEEVLELLVKLPNLESRKALLERLRSFGEDPVPTVVIEKLLGPQGIFRDFDSINDRARSEIFAMLAEGNPSAGLQALERLLGDLSVEELLKLNEGRRHIVWTLEKLAWLPETFEGAARLLLALAEAENESYGNNATGIWPGLFRTYLGGTAVPALERHKLLAEALESLSERRRLLALEGIDAALSAREMRMSHGERQAGRIVPPEWKPTSGKEHLEVRRSAFDLLKKAIADENEKIRNAAFEKLSDVSPNLVRFALGADLCSFIETLTPSDRQRSSLRQGLEDALEMYGGKLPADLSTRMKSLIARLTGTTFKDRLRRWVGELSWSDFGDEAKRERAAQQAISLAEEALDNPDLVKANLGWLSSDEARNVWIFAHRLGEIDEENSLLNTLSSNAKEGRGFVLLAGYLRGRADAGENEWRENLLDEWADTDRDMAAAVLECTWRGATTERGAKRLCNLVDKGWLEPEGLGILLWGGWTRDLTADAFEVIIETMLLGKGEGIVEAVLGVLDDRLKQRPEDQDKLDDLIWKAIERPEGLQGRSMLAYHWGNVAKRCVSKQPVRLAKLIMPLFETDDAPTLEGDARLNILHEAAKACLEEVWEEIGRYLVRKNMVGFRLMLALRGRFVADLPVDLLMNWTERHLPEGPVSLAQIAPVYGKALHPLSTALLSKYGEDESIGSSLSATFHSGSFSGDMSVWLKSKLQLAEEWSKSTDANVRKWAKKVADGLRKEIEKAKLAEEEEEW